MKLSPHKAFVLYKSYLNSMQSPMKFDNADKSWLWQNTTELRRDFDRIVFWIVVVMVGIAVAHGWVL